jgi:hypothetical protein
VAPKPRHQPVRYGKVTLASAVPAELGARVQRAAVARGISVSALLAEVVAARFPDPIPAASAVPDRPLIERNRP